MKLKKYLTEKKFRKTEYGEVYISDVEVLAIDMDKWESGKWSVKTSKTQHGLSAWNMHSQSKKKKYMTKAEVMKYVKELKKQMKDPKSLKIEFIKVEI